MAEPSRNNVVPFTPQEDDPPELVAWVRLHEEQVELAFGMYEAAQELVRLFRECIKK